MSTALILARFALFAVFAVAAIAKLADLPGSRQALEGFGVAPRFVRAGALALPAAELLAAGMLLSPTTAPTGAALGAALFAVFIAGIGWALRQGRRPDCHCFGQLHSRPAGSETIWRNVVLLCLAIFVLAVGPGPSFASWVADHDTAQVALAAITLVAAVLAYACVALWRENRRLSGRGAGSLEAGEQALQIGEPLPEFSLVAMDGAAVSSRDILQGGRTVLVFISSSCGPCVTLLPELARWRDMLVGRLAIRIVATGDEEVIAQLAREHDLPMLLDAGGTAGRALRVPATPSGIEIDAAGLVASLPASGSAAIEGLIRVALKRAPSNVGLRVEHVRSLGAAPVTD